MAKYFYGQSKIIRELNFLASDKSKNRNVLFIGQSGYGKTNLGWHLLLDLLEITPEEILYIEGNEQLQNGYRYIFVDECHLVENFETFYEMMDSNKYFFIFATNLYDDLPEAFLRRCITFLFSPYNDLELCAIAGDYFMENNISLSTELLLEIIHSTKRSPGFLLKLTERLVYIFQNIMIPKSKEDLNEILVSTLGIINGLDLQDQLYLDKLKDLGGTASLDRILSSTNLPKKIVLAIEPYLMEKKLIRITSKGRTLL